LIKPKSGVSLKYGIAHEVGDFSIYLYIFQFKGNKKSDVSVFVKLGAEDAALTDPINLVLVCRVQSHHFYKSLFSFLPRANSVNYLLVSSQE
jgi:hypothetical protein